jgi:hypothetical protein
MYLARAELGPAKTGQAALVRYQVVDLAGMELVAATNSGVAESLVPGNYYVGGGISLADDFAGRILWSVDAGVTWLAEEAVDLQLARRVWEHTPRTLTQSAVAVISAVTGDALSLLRGDTWTAQLTDVGALEGRSKLWFTMKAHSEDEDSDALVQVEESAGLLTLNGATGIGGQGTLEVLDPSAGDVNLELSAVATASLPPGRYQYDLQALIGETVVTRIAGTALIHADVTRAVS